VHAVDLFGDEDTRASAETVTVAPGDGELDMRLLPEIVQRLWAQYRPLGFVYGTGFEHCPEVLMQLCPPEKLFGNTPDVVHRVKDPAFLFPLLDRLGIAHPKSAWTGAALEPGWLVKRVGGAGGAHISRAPPGLRLASGYYRQRELTGRSMSALFLADGDSAELLGMCGHWCVQPDLLPAFAHSGIVRVGSDAVDFQRLRGIVAAIVKACQLRGLCGIDFICDPAGTIYVLEINPRPPASFELYQAEESMFAAHIHACQGHLSRPIVTPRSRAMVVCYAPTDLVVPQAFVWPGWAADRPRVASRISARSPLCTVFAEGDSAADARHLAQRRAHQIEALFAEANAGESIYDRKRRK